MEQNPDVRIQLGTTEIDILLIDDSSLSNLAVPLASFMDLLFYNIDILTAAGYDRPPETRDEFLTYARNVNRRNFPDTMGAALSLSPIDQQAISRDIFSWMWAAGGNFLSEENKVIFTSTGYNARAAANDITFLNSLIQEIQSQDIFEKTGNQLIEKFARGQIAMMIASTRYIPYFRGQMGDSAFGVTTIPSPGTGGRYNITLSSIYAGVCFDSPHPDEAWRFIKFLYEKKALFSAELNAIPGSDTDMIPGNHIRDDSFHHKPWEIFAASQIINSFSGKPNAKKFEAAFLEELQVFSEGGRTALQTATAIDRRWEEIQRAFSESER
jgi:ABC-type glycerol-3-phosphate transport system substrate-binding protein